MPQAISPALLNLLTPQPVRRRHYQHNSLSPAALDWFKYHFDPGGFNGRFQIGFRRSGEQGIYPLYTGDYKTLGEFLATMHVSKSLDYYITANSFNGVERKAESLFGLHNIVVDVDLHTDERLSVKEILEFPRKKRMSKTGSVAGNGNLEYDVFQGNPLNIFCQKFFRDVVAGAGPPSPTAIVYTGRGIQLWWHIIPISIKCVTWYQEIQQTLVMAIDAMLQDYPELAEFQIDGGASSNKAGYFRLPGTMNTVARRTVLIKESNQNTYSTHDLIKWAKGWKKDNVLPSATPPEPQTTFAGQYSDGDVYILKNLHTMGFFRVRQMIQLRILRDNDVGEETRNNMCFIVYNALLPAIGHDAAWDKLLSFNSGFKQPMTEVELHHTIDTAHKKNGYRYRNETLITFLGITPAEQQAIGLFAPSSPFTPYARLAPNASRNASKKTLKEDRNAKILALSQQGLSNVEVAAQLGINRDTVAAVIGPKASGYAEAAARFEAGESNGEIGQALGISVRTLQRYRKKWKETADATSAEKVFYK